MDRMRYNQAMSVTFVIPVYNEVESLDALAAGIVEHAAGVPHRILFVDDGSTDGSWERMLALRERHATVDALRLRRNFGKTVALRVGFSAAHGERVIMMDADLQDDPKEIPRMLAKLDEGYDLVCGWKQRRHDPWHKTLPSRVYNRWVARLFGVPIHDVNTGFKAMRMEVARRVPLFGDMHRLIPVFADGLGYRVTEIPVTHHPRRFGQSKYGFDRFAKGALDVVTARFLLHFNESPVRYFARAALFLLLGVIAAAAACGGVLALSGADALAWAALLVMSLGTATLGTGLLCLLCIGLQSEWRLQHTPPPDYRLYIAETQVD